MTLSSLYKASKTCAASYFVHDRVLVQTHAMYYTATSFIPPYSSTVLHHPVDSSFTLHINTHYCVHKPHPRVFPTTVRTSYTLSALIQAYLSLALLHCTKETAVVSAKYSLPTTTLSFVLYSSVKLHICLEICRCSCSLLPSYFAIYYPSTLFRHNKNYMTFFSCVIFSTCDTPGISRLPHPEGEACILV